MAKPKKKIAAKKATPRKKTAVPVVPTPPKRLKVMVSSSVYKVNTEVHQICGILTSYGYDVLNSEIGTIYPPLTPGDSILEACLLAVEQCDIFLGVITPFYGTSGHTHREFQHAIALNKPRRFICHKYVTFSRQLFEPFRYNKARNGRIVRTGFTIHKTGVMDDIRVIDMYEDSVQNRLPEDQRKYRWVQEYFHFNEAMTHIRVLFEDRLRVEADLANFNNI